nr:basic helix-loop-helix transcription factor [Loropetalum chinense var. rubrum]
MEISPFRGLSELGMEDPFFIHQWMNSFDEPSAIPIATAFADNLQHTFSHPTFNHKTSMETSYTDIERPPKQLKTNSWNSCKLDPISNPQPASCPNILSFVNSNCPNQVSYVKPKEEQMSSKSITATSIPSDILTSQGSFGNQSYVFKANEGAKKSSTTARSSQTQDHIIAERKRREKLSQRFIALSAIVPGLKKTDKASVLSDAIKYLKQLQDRVKTLEEQTRKKTMETVVFVKKSQILADGETSSSDENFSEGPFDEPLPEIEARFSDKNVLIRVHCEKKKGILERTVAEIEKLHLTVTNSSVMTFGSSALDVTIIAQMDTEFCMSVKDLVKTLRSAFQLFM